MDKIKSKPGLLACFNGLPPDVRRYFEHLPALIESLPLDVALSYVFARVELAHNMALYCGITKLHRASSEMAYHAVQKHHMTRAEFRAKYAVIYGNEITDVVANLLTHAEGVRDHVMHGKSATDDQKRNAIANVLRYAVGFNECTVALHGPKPFGDLRGYKGAAQALDKSTTRWMLKGMGFNF